MEDETVTKGGYVRVFGVLGLAVVVIAAFAAHEVVWGAVPWPAGAAGRGQVKSSMAADDSGHVRATLVAKVNLPAAEPQEKLVEDVNAVTTPILMVRRNPKTGKLESHSLSNKETQALKTGKLAPGNVPLD